MKSLKPFFDEVNTPTEGSSYVWSLLFFGHAKLGMVAAAVLILALAAFGANPFWYYTAVLLPFIYWAVKEAPDLDRGGKRHDGLVDTAGVMWGITVLFVTNDAGLVWGSVALLMGAIFTVVGGYRRLP